MNQEPAGFFKRKSTWAGLTAIFGGIGGYITHTVDPASAAVMVLQGISTITLRSAIAKSTQTEPN